MTKIKNPVKRAEKFIREMYKMYKDPDTDCFDIYEEYKDVPFEWFEYNEQISEEAHIYCKCLFHPNDLTLNVRLKSPLCSVKCGCIGELGDCNLSNPDTVEEVIDRVEKVLPKIMEIEKLLK